MQHIIELGNIVHLYLNICTLIIFLVLKKQYALRVTINWLQAVKPMPHELLPPQNIESVSCGSSILPSNQTHMSFNSTGFCRAVGGPTASQQFYGCSTTSSLMPATSSVILLNYMCQISGFGQPHYEIFCHRAGPDGYLHFSYKVLIPERDIFEGMIMILPGTSVTSTMEEAREAVAQQVLRQFFNRTFH